MRHRIALCGFSEFECRAMRFSFQHPAGLHESDYDVVEALADADFAIVDADSKSAVKGVIQSGRLAHAVFVGAQAPIGAASHLPRPIDTGRILRTLNDLSARQTIPGVFHDAPQERRFSAIEAACSEPEPPPLDDVFEAPPTETSIPLEAFDPTCESPRPGTDVASPGVAPSAVPTTPMVDAAARRALQSLAKAAARAAARRARLASAQATGGSVEPLRDVLVLGADSIANTLLCALLERFGFQAHSVRSIDRADAEIARRPFAAAFLDIALDEAGVELLRRIRSLPDPEPHAAPAVLMVTAHLDPADRVRAALAGVSAPLIKPLSRGDVARALEAVGVTLPSDARRL